MGHAPSALRARPANQPLTIGEPCDAQALRDVLWPPSVRSDTIFPDEAPGEQMTIEVPSFLIRTDRGVVLFADRDDVTHVINSHFHFDHCGCNALFPRRRSSSNVPRWTWPVQQRAPTTQPTGTIRSTIASSMANTTCSPTARSLLIPTPGHTAGHQSLCVHAAPGVDFCSPPMPATAEHIWSGRVPVAGAGWNPELMIETFARLRTFQERQGCHLIFGHDPNNGPPCATHRSRCIDSSSLHPLEVAIRQ